MNTVKGHVDWVDSLLQAIENCGEEGQTAAAYLRARKIRIGFQRVRPSVGAFWTPFGSICLNSLHYSYATPLTNPRILTQVIHETRHLQQGPVESLSVHGELDAWQLEFRLLGRLSGMDLHPMIDELISLPLGWDRNVLRRARGLMQSYAGKGYRIDLLPLFPIGRELAYMIRGNQSSPD